ncbi:uncharacterized protein LOC130995918 isoform X2 [Salvia miltiorrhiza]|uniref:uncharacterized protein LOC130995918 isoform X2 n=1 Tax=Salvia miltiorrhiza TaxID=226208 RepID=UPI0025ACE8AD|nr:uncharacterized protein LOC130995918 isoform X2 [Salvia miltiorrhiza]
MSLKYGASTNLAAVKRFIPAFSLPPSFSHPPTHTHTHILAHILNTQILRSTIVLESMGKTRKDDKSDDIEILSIGKLYNGAWDKKYWSSSRGKDRYPYPVGYKSVRTQNGITYTMEITEGLKGPSFKISSTDGKSCSGETPEIAWESFQKKGSSKALHAKRFSCKIDSVEFFGFKNTFVQRLLRELATNVGGPAERSLLMSNFSAGAHETNYQLQGKPSDPVPDPDPDMLTCLFKSHAKGKRSRNGRRRLNETPLKLLQMDESTKNVSSSTSKQRDQSNSRSSDLSSFSAANEVHGVCYTPGSLGPQKCVPIADGGVKLNSLDIFDHLNVGESLSEGKKLISSVNHIEQNIDNPQKQQEYSGRSSYFEVQNNILPEDRDGENNVQHDILVASPDLCVADSLDHSEDSSSVSSQNKDVLEHSTEKDAIINDVKNSEVLEADSLPEDEMVKASYNTNSGKCATESVGDERAMSMMMILLPQAVPLLKTFSRKKKKSTKSLNTQRSHENNDLPSTSINDSTTARVVEHSDLQRKNENACIPCVVHDSAVCTSVNLDFVVPDSFDDYSPPEMLHHAGAVKSGQLTCDLHPPPYLPINGEANELPCHSGSSKPDTGMGGLTSMAVADAVSPHEFTANSKRAKLDYCSIDSMIPTTDCDNSSSNLQLPTTSCSSLTGNIKLSDDSRSNIQHKLKLRSKLQGHLGFFACYIHPMPISMVQLIVKENEIFMCVKCGYSELKDDILFVYKTSRKGVKTGCPSLVGHLPISLQLSKDTLGRDIASERSLCQLTPDGGLLVLLNSIKIPHCREGILHCLCSACSSNGFEKNAVKIVRLNSGYASLVTRLKTDQGVFSLLVCEPNFLLAAEEGGKLKLWVMNSGWSGQKEDCYLPTFDFMVPCIVELKIVPKSAVLIIGHNGFGEFGIWDIDKRNLVSRFSSAGMSVFECIPVSIFRWQRKVESKTEALVAEIMGATKMWSSGGSDDHVFSAEDKDVAVWLLISTASDLDHEPYQSCEEEEANADGCWKLALLVNNMVITGSIVDEGAAAAAATSAGHGIIGRRDGQVYMLELSTGKKLEILQTLKGRRVSCIKTDTGNLGALAIASEGHLLVYLPS